jgi:hypothetical protein
VRGVYVVATPPGYDARLSAQPVEIFSIPYRVDLGEHKVHFFHCS